MEKRYHFLENMHLRVINQFSEILKFLQIFWSNLVGAIGFLEVVEMDLILILLKGLEQNKIF